MCVCSNCGMFWNVTNNVQIIHLSLRFRLVTFQLHPVISSVSWLELSYHKSVITDFKNQASTTITPEWSQPKWLQTPWPFCMQEDVSNSDWMNGDVTLGNIMLYFTTCSFMEKPWDCQYSRPLDGKVLGEQDDTKNRKEMAVHHRIVGSFHLVHLYGGYHQENNVMDTCHPSHPLFSPLLSGRRDRTLKA